MKKNPAEQFPDPMRIAGEEKDEPKEEKPKSEKEKALLEAQEKFGEFFSGLEKTINAYFGTSDMTFTVKPGGWYIDLEEIRVNADPTFFIEKGYNKGESLFATFHEAEHFRDMVQDPDAFQALTTRIRKKTDVHPAFPKALHRLYNCLDDVHVNRKVMNRWKAGRKAKDSLYPKLFPTADFRGQPRHRQLMYALLREAMMPGEKCELDPEVREALEEWQGKGGSKGFLELITRVTPMGNAEMNAAERYKYIKITLEETFEKFYKKDLEDRKPPKEKKGEGEKGEKGEKGEQQEGGDPFGDDPFEDAIPDPVDFEDKIEAAKKINQSIAKKKKDRFKELMGVEKKDFDAYKKDYKKVEEYIKEMSSVWDEIIQRRKEQRRVLRKSVKEGPMLDPKRTATGMAEIKAGHLDPTMMLDYEKKEVIRNQPNRIEVTMVCDGSGSMSIQKRDEMQRRMGVLTIESLADFKERVQRERRRGAKIKLSVKSEVRIFSDEDEVVKPLSESFSHKQRVAMHKKLRNLPGKGNNEPATFEAIMNEQFDAATIKALQKGDLKKLIVFYTDGETDVAAVQMWIKKLKKMAGKEGQKNLVIAGIGFGDGVQVSETYAPEGYFANSLADVPAKFKQIIGKFMKDV